MRKSPLRMSLDERKSVLIQACFLEAADCDYLVARWAYTVGLFENFYWSAAQCIEKYLKAALLYNGHSVKNKSHNIINMWNMLGKVDPEIKLKIISMPATTAYGRGAWNGQSMTLFVDYLNQYGSPDARYSMVGTFINGPVIHPLDSCCASIRELIRRANFLSSDLFHWSRINSPFREQARADCGWMIDPELLLERLYVREYQVGESEKLRETFQNMNFAFFDKHNEGEVTFGGQQFSMAPIRNHLLRALNLDSSEQNRRIVAELRSWADANMKLPNDIQNALQDVAR